MTMKQLIRSHSVLVTVLAVLLVAIALWLWPLVHSIWPAVGPTGPLPSVSPSASVQPGEPYSVLGDSRVSILTDQVPGARDLLMDSLGNLWVSQTREGIVSLVTLENGAAVVQPILTGLRNPHGLALDPDDPFLLYVAEEHRISRIRTYSEGALEKIADLPSGGRHFTRSLAFGPDGRLYVSIGSTCDVCFEEDPEISTVISMEKDGSDRRIEATGLRNAVFIQFNAAGDLWVTEMGRDHLGDHLPPDEVNRIALGGAAEDYGWPICYGDRVHDTVFDDRQYVRDPCLDTTPPVIELPAHVAPLGLAFLDTDLLIAYHGSWNSSVPVGYKVVRWTREGGQWQSHDFLTGFLQDGSSLGRPVDVLPVDDGTIYISDDKRGAIWRIIAAS